MYNSSDSFSFVFALCPVWFLLCTVYYCAVTCFNIELLKGCDLNKQITTINRDRSQQQFGVFYLFLDLSVRSDEAAQSEESVFL